jgi:hypothetical protein
MMAWLFVACGEKKSTDASDTSATAADTTQQLSYYIDVHDLEPGKVAFADVADAHAKDLATQDKYGVKFIKYWVDESKGKVYCLSQAPNAELVSNTHKEAHGLVPSAVYEVTEGKEAPAAGNKQYFLDIHHMGPGKVTAADVAAAHEKDLAVQGKHGVNFINYWVDEKSGVIMCLAEAADSNAVKKAHEEAHGLVPAQVLQVKEGK